MGNPDDADRPAAATIETSYALARTVPALPRPDRVPGTTPASVATRSRSVGPHRPKPGLGEYLIVARRRP
jgi:hypothetical protein